MTLPFYNYVNLLNALSYLLDYEEAPDVHISSISHRARQLEIGQEKSCDDDAYDHGPDDLLEHLAGIQLCFNLHADNIKPSTRNTMMTMAQRVVQ